MTDKPDANALLDRILSTDPAQMSQAEIRQEIYEVQALARHIRGPDPDELAKEVWLVWFEGQGLDWDKLRINAHGCCRAVAAFIRARDIATWNAAIEAVEDLPAKADILRLIKRPEPAP